MFEPIMVKIKYFWTMMCIMSINPIKNVGKLSLEMIILSFLRLIFVYSNMVWLTMLIVPLFLIPIQVSRSNMAIIFTILPIYFVLLFFMDLFRSMVLLSGGRLVVKYMLEMSLGLLGIEIP